MRAAMTKRITQAMNKLAEAQSILEDTEANDNSFDPASRGSC